MIARVIFELISGKLCSGRDEIKKFLFTIFGIIVIGFAYVGFFISKSMPHVFISYIVLGIGLGIASPPKNSLFSTHLDRNKETSEWGIYDGMVFLGMALSGALGGFIVKVYNFHTLFLLAAIIPGFPQSLISFI